MILVRTSPYSALQLPLSRSILRVIISSFLVAQLLSSCGENNAAQLQSDSVQRMTITEEMIEDIINDQFISCPQGDCPEALARIFVLNKRDAAQSFNCSGFLIEEDLLLTNAHCLDVGNIQRACDNFYAFFSDYRTGAIKARCQEVIYKSRSRNRFSNLFRDDIALVQLDRQLPIHPLRLNSEATSETRLRAYVIDHLDPYRARAVHFDCHSQDIVHLGDRVLELDCPIISGNSGSPLIGTRSNMVEGIVFAAHVDNTINARTELERRINTAAKGLGLAVQRIQEIIIPALSNHQW